MMDADMRAYIDRGDEVTRAQNDSRFYEVLSQLRKLDDIPKIWQIAAIAVGVGFSVFLGVVAILAFGGDRFDGGVQVSTSSLEQLTTVKAIAQENTEQIRNLSVSVNETNKQIESLITKIDTTAPRNENAQ